MTETASQNCSRAGSVVFAYHDAAPDLLISQHPDAVINGRRRWIYWPGACSASDSTQATWFILWGQPELSGTGSLSDSSAVLGWLTEQSETHWQGLGGDFQLILWQEGCLTLICGPGSRSSLNYLDDGWVVAAGLGVFNDAESFRSSFPSDHLAVNVQSSRLQQLPPGHLIQIDRFGVNAKPIESVKPIAARQRILCLMSEAFGGYGGIQQANRDLAQALISQPAIDGLHLLVRQGRSQKPMDGVLQTAPGNGKPGFLFYCLFLALFRSSSFAFVFCGHLRLLWLSWLVAKLARRPLWLHLHGIEAWDAPGRVTRWMASRVALVTCVSRYTRERFLDWADIDAANAKVLPNMAKAQFVTASPDPAWRQRWGAENKRIILTTARLGAGEGLKGHDLLFSALRELVQTQSDICLMIVGEGVAKASLQAQVSALSLSESVIFAGRLSDDDLVSCYQQADLFVLPSRKEGFGIVFLEALLCGCPVIGFGDDGSRDPLQDGRLGTISSPETLVADILQQLKQGRRPGLAERAQASFGIQQFVERVHHCCTRMMESHV